VQNEASTTLKQTNPVYQVNSTAKLSYFGKSIAVGDFDGDGNKEAFVGAPGYSLQGFGQLGAVYFQSLDVSQPHPEIDSSKPHLTGQEQYTRFGFSLAALDLNNDGADDLVVSAPAFGLGGVTDIGDYYAKAYYGRLYVYLATKGLGIQKGSQPDFEVRVSRSGDSDVFFNLGQNLKVSDCNGDGKQDLIVLSPMAQQGGDKRGYAAVFFDILGKANSGSNVIYLEDADFKAFGKENYQWFGFDAVCTNDHTIVIGSPGKRTSLNE
jgi:hypothetical protein